MTIKQQGGIFGRNPTFNDVDATDITSSTITATASVSTPVETISGNTSSVAFSSNSSGMLFSGGTDATKYSGIVFRGATSWNTFLGRIPDGAADPLVIGNDAISAFGSICTFGANDVTVNRGNLVIGTSGKGIDFSATSGTGTSELFNDYEEGTFSPTYVPASGAFDAITYNTQEGYYTKIGNMINVRLFLRIASLTKGAASGGVNIGGLPYAAANSRATAAVYSDLFLVNHPSICQASGSQLILYYRAASNGSSETRVEVTDLDTGSTENRALISICYQAS
jgi:hypothetical protein